MAQEILLLVITSLLTLLTGGGIGVFLYHKQTKKLKEAESKSAEIQNDILEVQKDTSVNDQWKEMCEMKSAEIEKLNNKIAELEESIKVKNEKIEVLNTKKEEAWDETSKCKILSAKKDRIISEINWYRCEVNNCPHRKPPRKFGTFDYPQVKEKEESIEEENEK